MARTFTLTNAGSAVTLLRRVWLERALGLIYESYSHRVRLHSSYGEGYGRDDAITEAVQELAAFPNLRFRSEDALVSDGQDGYVSHIAFRSARNTGYSLYGLPTGKQIRWLAATDLLLQGSYITETWRVQDGLSLTTQLGLSHVEAVGAVVKARPVTQSVFGDGAVRPADQEPPKDLPEPSPDQGPEAFIAWIWYELWARRRFDRIAQAYAADYRFVGPSGVRLRTREAFTAYVLGLLAAFPDAVMELEHIFCDRDRVGVRWRLSGTHDGPSRYGEPTGRRITILGITHYRLQNRQLIGECTIFDELALLAQIHKPTTGSESAQLPREPETRSDQ